GGCGEAAGAAPRTRCRPRGCRDQRTALGAVRRRDPGVDPRPDRVADRSGRRVRPLRLPPTQGRRGVSAAFAYRRGRALGSARRFRRSLQNTFAEVLLTPTVWRNMPPAFVY